MTYIKMEPFIIGVTIGGSFFACLLTGAAIYKWLNQRESDRTRRRYAEIRQLDMCEII